jgi:TATA-binding protein-associated factor
MKSVTYLRLDGSVETEKRFEIVKAFNSDPTIDVLLLTTHVGGLGLNLTSADTLVFVEHDWNPMRDLQAMDRAHRLGQKKVVNVHRLIMRGTLEEKVMSLQRFKVSVANAVINAENASLKTMNTDQLLDLFASAEIPKKGSSVAKSSEDNADGGIGTGKGLKAILGGLEDLWDQSQYTEEYNLSQFLAKLNG